MQEHSLARIKTIESLLQGLQDALALLKKQDAEAVAIDIIIDLSDEVNKQAKMILKNEVSSFEGIKYQIACIRIMEDEEEKLSNQVKLNEKLHSFGLHYDWAKDVIILIEEKEEEEEKKILRMFEDNRWRTVHELKMLTGKRYGNLVDLLNVLCDWSLLEKTELFNPHTKRTFYPYHRPGAPVPRKYAHLVRKS